MTTPPLEAGPERPPSRFDGYVEDAACRLVAAGVYPSIRAVAARAGVSHSTAYRGILRLRDSGRFPHHTIPCPRAKAGRLEQTARAVRQAYRDLIADGRMPTTRRIAEATGRSRTCVWGHLGRLRAAGELPRVPAVVVKDDATLLNRLRDRPLYEAVLKVHALGRDAKTAETRMTYADIAAAATRLLGRPVTLDQVGRCLNVTGYYRHPHAGRRRLRRG